MRRLWISPPANIVGIALEQSAALVEGKVTPRLAGLLDSIKDERKASLAVADPKLGIHFHTFSD